MLAASFSTSPNTPARPILSTLVLPIHQAVVGAQAPASAFARPPVLAMQPIAPTNQASLSYNQSIQATQGAAQTPNAPIVSDAPTAPTGDMTTPSSAGTAATVLGPGATGAATSLVQPNMAATLSNWWTDVKPYAPYAIGGLVLLGVGHFVFRHLL